MVDCIRKPNFFSMCGAFEFSTDRNFCFLQRSHCALCGELPEAHFYYYAHHNKQLTIQVKRLPKHLPGEAEGKLWMWSRCGKCKTGNRISKCTKRVLISTAACGLSFGKFLELSFSEQSSGLSSCGHSLHWDFLYFFGYGLLFLFSFNNKLTLLSNIFVKWEKCSFLFETWTLMFCSKSL